MSSRERLTNRHIAKLLTRLEPLKIPEIALSDIKRQMWFLSEDIYSSAKKESVKHGERTEEF